MQDITGAAKRKCLTVGIGMGQCGDCHRGRGQKFYRESHDICAENCRIKKNFQHYQGRKEENNIKKQKIMKECVSPLVLEWWDH